MMNQGEAELERFTPSVLQRFPKQRPPLPAAVAAVYVRQYKENRAGSTPAAAAAQWMEAWLHRCVAEDVASGKSMEARTLELGAGNLNQLPYEKCVQPYDIVEPFEALYRESPYLARVRTKYTDIRDVPTSLRYDRITSVAALEHLCDLPVVVARAGQLLAEGGSFRASIPNEGSWLWTLGWYLTTGLEFRLRHGLDYGDIMRHEHVNTADEIEVVLRYFFSEVHGRSFGPTPRLSLYRFFECRRPVLARCAAAVAVDGQR